MISVLGAVASQFSDGSSTDGLFEVFFWRETQCLSGACTDYATPKHDMGPERIIEGRNALGIRSMKTRRRMDQERFPQTGSFTNRQRVFIPRKEQYNHDGERDEPFG